MVSSVKLLRIEVDKKLNFEQDISIFAKNQQANKCKLKTANVWGHKEKEAIINTLVHSNFNYGCGLLRLNPRA